MVNIPKMPLDVAFPQLGAVTSPESIREILQRSLPRYSEGDLCIERVRIERFQYKPSKRCDVCYRIEVSMPHGEARKEAILYGLLDGRGRAKSLYERERKRVDVDPDLVPAIHFIEELDMVLWGFPNDPRMKRLHELFDARAFSSLLARRADASGLALDSRFLTLETRVAKYVPGVRCVLEHRAWRDSASHGEPALHLYSKTYEDDRGKSIFRTMQQLWSSEGRRDGRLNMPEPLFYDEQHRAIFSRPIPGFQLVDVLDEIEIAKLAPQLGLLLASIHCSDLRDLPALHPQQSIENLRKASATLTAAYPALSARLGAFTKRIEESLPDTCGLPSAPLHGAFRLSQVLVADGKLVLLDFDGLLIGNPASDVGSLCAHFLYQTVKSKITLKEAREGIARFCASYREASPWGLPVPALRWFTAAEIVAKHAKKIVKRGKKDSQRKIDELLTLADSVVLGKEPLG